MLKVVFTVFFLQIILVTSEQGPSAIIQASNEFTLRLYREVSARPGNVLVSGTSVHMGLALLHQGAEGRTAQELARVLQLTSGHSNVNNDYRNIITSLKGRNLHIVTTLYSSNKIQVKSGFSTLAKHFFLSDIAQANFSNAGQAAEKINSYVAHQTNNKIHDLITADSIKPTTALILVNALHFQAQWKTPFKDVNEQGHFKVSSLQSVRATMMSQTNYFDYRADNHLGAKILKMNYISKGGDYFMLLVLPMRLHDLYELESKLVNINPEHLLQGLKPTNVKVTIPRFRIEENLELKESLSKMGVHESFTQNANFAKIAEGPLSLSNVVQKSYIDVNENGTEAAIATSSQIRMYSWSPFPVIFQANHPFMFFIFKGKEVLFSGRLQRPEAKLINRDLLL